MNPQMYNRFVSPATVTVIEVRRSEWLGPVRMGGERWVQNQWKANEEEEVKKKDLDLVGWMMSLWT